jgi:1,2-phenylacetyl-CoA epoxidase catalytic subunit
MRKALLDLTAEHIQKAAKEVKKLGDGTEDHQLASARLEAVFREVQRLGEKVHASDVSVTRIFSKATEKALLKALKVVLSNARSAKVGTKTALDIVEAVSSSH